MKIVYFGSDVFIDVFQYLQANHEVLALYTYNNEEDYFNEHSIVRLAHIYGIPVYYSQIRELDMIRFIEQEGCGLFITAEYSHKIPVPDHPSFRGMNIHSSYLPEGRSYYPIECAMVQGFTQSGVTIHKIARELDRGDIIAKKRYDISPRDDSVDIYLKSARLAREMMEKIMPDFENSWRRAVSQKKVLPYWERPNSQSMTLRHDMTTAMAGAIYREFNKMTEVCIDGQLFRVDSFATGSAILGTSDTEVIFVRDNRVLYGVEDGHLRLDIEAIQSRGA